MIKVFSSPNLAIIHNMKNVLAFEGIECDIRGEYLQGGVGELPPNEAWAELWIVHDEDAARAREIIHAARNDALSPEEPWTCPHCGEMMEPQFAACWRCEMDTETQ